MNPDTIAALKEQTHKILEIIKTDLSSVRTGRANPSLVENIQISAYGGSAKLRVLELATVVATDSQTLVITPFDQSTRDDIRKGIFDAGTGLNPADDGQVLRITIPPLSKERREELIKMMRHKLENGKIMVRQARHEAMSDVKKMHDNKEISDDELHRHEKEIQKVVDDTIATIESMGDQKEQDLLAI